MKKIVFTLLAVSTVLISCRDNDDSLLDSKSERYISQDQLNDLVKKFPEKASLVTEGFEAGNNKYLTAFQNSHERFGYMSVLFATEHLTNDFVATNSSYPHFVTSHYRFLSTQVNSASNTWVWTYYYKVIYNMNLVLKNIPDNSNNSSSQYIKGRALAMRALAYLDLVRLYGAGEKGIPYYSQTVYENARVPSSTVMGYIEEDLKQAHTLLEGYKRTDKQSIDKNVVAGLLARYYIANKKYNEAAQYAKEARTGYNLMSKVELLDGFSNIQNPEWMWGTDIDGSTSTVYASFFSHIGNKNRGYAGLGPHRSIDKRLYEKISDTDTRKQWFLNSDTNIKFVGTNIDKTLPKYANVKFVDPSGSAFLGDYVYMRVAEMYFIEAEAKAELGNDAEAQTVLYEIMSKRDSSYAKSTKTGQELKEEIRVNKRIELWGEGHSFFDLKRWGMDIDRNYTDTNHPAFGQVNIPAGDNKLNFQIPQAELDANKKVSN